MIKNKENSEHYSWGDRCSGWPLVATDQLSVIQEHMPSNTQEIKHYHSKAQQFFYILNGMATFELENERINIKKGEGIHVKAGKVHQISNENPEPVEFLVISQPTTRADRIEVHQDHNKKYIKSN